MKLIFTLVILIYSTCLFSHNPAIYHLSHRLRCYNSLKQMSSNEWGPDSSIINKYAAVTAICDNGTLQVDDPFEFRVGNKILIYQAQGAVIDTSNTADFGKILDYAQAGNYEFNYIAAINGSTIRLRDTLLRGYDVTGKVQIVTVPVFADIVLKNTVCKVWDGSTGGILVFDAENLTLEGNLDVSGRGFRGGAVFNTGIPCGVSGYKYPEKFSSSSYKGEGIAVAQTSYAFGRGAIANGGGGGNAINAGGAGGSNSSLGGAGGNQVSGCTNPNLTGGVGGRNLAYSTNINKIFMGGGGGAGHSDNNNGTAGGQGGGIIIINAQKIVGNRQSIKSNGLVALSGNANTFTDGQGGGGAGGAIFMNVPQDSISVVIELKGGDGGTVLRSNFDIHGPGGGGSGGVLLLKNTDASNFTSLNLIGGKNGIYTNTNTPHGATAGQNGQTVTDFTAPQSMVKYKSLAIDSIEKTPLCNGKESIKIHTSGSQPPFQYSINNGATWQQTNLFQELSEGTFTIKIKKNDCISKDTTIRISPSKSDTVRRDSSVCYPSVSTTFRYRYKKTSGCDSVIFVTTKVNKGDTTHINTITCDLSKAGTDTVILKTHLGCDSLVITTATFQGNDTTVFLTICEGDNSRLRAYSKTGIYKEIFRNKWGCDSIVTLNVTVLDTSIMYNEILICKGDSVKIGNLYYTTAVTLKDTLQNSQKCDSIIVSQIKYDSRCKNCEPFIPNAFSPNNDGSNDVFEIFNNNSTISELTIFNRWGSLIYYEKSEKPQWDGTWKGEILPSDIYIYFVRATCRTGKEVVWKGDINLVR